MTRQPQAGYSHVTITVTDVDASRAWYERVLGLEVVAERTAESWHRVVLASPSGFRLGLTTHTATALDDRFDETRVGLDHLSIACADAAEVAAWAEHFEDVDVVHGEVVDAGYATVLVARDPDGIPVEFFAPAAI